MEDQKKQDIEEALVKICQSGPFSNSGRNIRLLKFLVEKALSDAFVKEQIVGFELFQKDYDPSAGGSKVRVYMYKLRKKLTEYYAEEGKDDKLKFELKKGQYNLTFIENKSSVKVSLPWWKITITICVLALLVFFGQKMIKPEPDLWSSYYNSKNETICFLSDHYTLFKKGEFNNYFTHVSLVNGESDFHDYQTYAEDTSYSVATFSYLTKMAPMAVQSLTQMFTKHNAQFVVELDSEFNYGDLKNNNLIFLGQFSCLHQSGALFLDNSKVFRNNIGSFSYISGKDTTHYFNSVREDRTRDYVMVTYRKMDNGNSLMFFASNHDIGVIAAVRNFTNKRWLKDFYQQFPEDVEAFNALFDVSGYKRTELSCKLVQIEYLQ